MASINKLKTGKYQARVSYYDETGARHFRKKNNFRTKREAQRWATNLEQEKFDNSIGLINEKQTFSDYYQEWLETYKFNKVARITEQEYRYTLRQITELLPDVKLQKMTRIRYQQFINKFTHGNEKQRAKRNLTGNEPYHSKASVEKLHGHIHAAVLDAVADGVLKRDFCRHAELRGHSGKNVQLKYLDADDMQKLINAVTKNISLTSTSKSMIYTGLMTGMRVGEVSALTWQDIDWNNKTISINKSWDYQYTHDFKPAKTPSSVRKIDVTNKLLNHLKRLHALQMASKMDNPKHLVFLNNCERIPSPGACDLLLKKYHQTLGIKRISFHGLRHTHASYLLYRNVKMEYISKRLGHKNTSVTRNIYAHIIKEDQKQETKKALKALRNF